MKKILMLLGVQAMFFATTTQAQTACTENENGSCEKTAELAAYTICKYSNIKSKDKVSEVYGICLDYYVSSTMPMNRNEQAQLELKETFEESMRKAMTSEERKGFQKWLALQQAVATEK